MDLQQRLTVLKNASEQALKEFNTITITGNMLPTLIKNSGEEILFHSARIEYISKVQRMIADGYAIWDIEEALNNKLAETHEYTSDVMAVLVRTAECNAIRSIWQAIAPNNTITLNA